MYLHKDPMALVLCSNEKEQGPSPTTIWVSFTQKKADAKRTVITFTVSSKTCKPNNGDWRSEQWLSLRCGRSWLLLIGRRYKEASWGTGNFLNLDLSGGWLRRYKQR